MKKFNFERTMAYIMAVVALILCASTNYFAEAADALSIELEAEKIRVSTTEYVAIDYIVEEYDTVITVETSEVELIARTVWGEARGSSAMEQSAVVWCILNRVDAGYGTIEQVVTAPGQFAGYNKNYPISDSIKALVEDVLARWQMEKICAGNVGRTLPSNYLWFHGDGKHNYFRDKFNGDYNTWDWNCWNPYA